MLYQTKALVAFRSREELCMNTGYMIITLVNFFLIFRSYKLNVSMETTVYPSFIFLLLRNLIRVLDLENTKQFKSDSEWYNLIQLQTMSFSFLTCLFLLSFYSFRGCYVFFFLMYLALYLIEKHNDGQLDSAIYQLNWNLIVFWLLLAIYISYYNNR